MITLEQAQNILEQERRDPFSRTIQMAMETIITLNAQIASGEKVAAGGPSPFCFCPVCGEWTNGKADGQFLLQRLGGSQPDGMPPAAPEGTLLELVCSKNHSWAVEISVRLETLAFTAVEPEEAK